MRKTMQKNMKKNKTMKKNKNMKKNKTMKTKSKISKMKGGLQTSIIPYTPPYAPVSSTPPYTPVSSTPLGQYPILSNPQYQSTPLSYPRSAYPPPVQVQSMIPSSPRVTLGCPKGMSSCTMNNVKKERERKRRLATPPHHM
jgi:hypothetical protein